MKSVDPGHSAYSIPVAEDAHPIQPFHHVIKSEGFKPERSEHTTTGRINHYTKENPGGGTERVELHHDRGTGKVNSITKSGDPEASLAHSNNSSPAKLHRNIHEASYRAPTDVPKPFNKGQIAEHQKKMSE